MRRRYFLRPGGAFIVVCKNRSAFADRYPGAVGSLAPNQFTGALDNSGETIGITLPAPWAVHILNFRYESTWSALASGGGYSLVVRDASATAARLVNLATRAQTLGGANALIPGFFVSGAGAKRLLIRNVGPTLASLSVTGVLADPQLVLKRYDAAAATYVDVVANDNWGTTTAVSSLMNATAALGAFALASGSADASLLVDLPPGQYFAVAGEADNGTGIALRELYAADSGTSTAHLGNISIRGFVGTDGDVVIAGFVIAGIGAKTVLIRAVGPTLASFGLAGVLADPKLSIYRGTEVILTNDDWSTGTLAAAAAATATQLGAFALPPRSKDAAFVVTLPAGAYTVQSSGANNTTGLALVEIYEAP